MIIPLYIRKQNNLNFVFGPGFGTYYELKYRNTIIKKLLKNKPYKSIHHITFRHRLSSPIYPVIEMPEGVRVDVEWFHNQPYTSELIIPFKIEIFNEETLNIITFLNLVNEYNLNAQKLRWLKFQNLTGQNNEINQVIDY